MPEPRETMVTADHEDTAPRIEHAVRYRYPLDCGTRMAGADVTDVRTTRRDADRSADWHRRNGATVEIVTRTWTPSCWTPVDEACTEPLAAVVTFRVTEAERARIEADAARNGRSLSDHLRAVIAGLTGTR